MSTQPSILVSLFGSKTRADLITLFVMHPGESFYIRQIAELITQSTGAVVRDLDRLEQLGFLTSETRAHAKYYVMNSQSHIFPELQSLVLKTAGLADVLKKALRPFDSILFAFVYGSFASGEMGPKSDIDLFLVGTVSSMNLAKAMRSVQL
ncbi:MAG: nucleotidyltransferase domain-containing protein [Deltaproteobacteria bacterium]|nr:nucleotidyltransferase domain-containing protein [Deltaproteobacteria bacterium]